MYDIEILGGDINFTNGEFTLVRDEQKLVQSLIKILLTPLDDSSLRPNYGTDLTNSLGHAMPEFIYLSKIEDSVRSAIEFMIDMQNRASSRQYVSSGETISQLLSVSVVRDQSDSRQIDVNIAIRAGNGNIVERQFVIAPGAFVSQVSG